MELPKDLQKLKDRMDRAWVKYDDSLSLLNELMKEMDRANRDYRKNLKAVLKAEEVFFTAWHDWKKLNKEFVDNAPK